MTHASTMTYKHYTASILYDDDDGIFVGRVLGMNDVVGFHGNSVAELKAAFAEAVDDYVEACERIGKRPERTASGNLMLRVAPEVHTQANLAAEAAGKSLNVWAEEVLTDVLSSGAISVRDSRAIRIDSIELRGARRKNRKLREKAHK